MTGLAGLAFAAGDMREMRRHLDEATAIVAESSSPVNLCTLLLPYARPANRDGRHTMRLASSGRITGSRTTTTSTSRRSE